MPGLNSPQKRRQLVLSGLPPSPLASKRAQCDRVPLPSRHSRNDALRNSSQQFSVQGHNNVDSLLYSMAPDSATGEASDRPTVPASSVGVISMMPTPAIASSHDSQLALLAEETYVERMSQHDALISDKGTKAAYGRHLTNYEKWWNEDQARRVHEAGASGPVVPAHPITATKVALFMKYESTRELRAGRNQKAAADSRVGRSSIRQCISALENERFRLQHRNDYAQCNDAQKPLRNDNQIKFFEKLGDATEAERVIQVQLNKADGVQSDTFTETELVQASVFLLEQPGGKSASKVHNSICTRAMLLLSTSTALRGDNLRRLLLSDMFLRDIPLVDIGLDHTETALVAYSQNGKENSTGRVDEQGAFRHRIPALCPIGALALYMFSLFHIVNAEVPGFEPDYSHPGAGSIGFRQWYQLYLFITGTDFSNSISYENQRKRLNKLKMDTNVHFKKVTHSGRHFAVEQAAKWGAPVESRQMLGGWNMQGSMRPCYDRALPTDAMLAAAGFSATKQATYFISRGVLEPPEVLLRALFPWVEDAHEQLLARIREHGRDGQDNALKNLLELLVFFRRVLLQDAAVLFTAYPSSPLFSFAPFNSPTFRNFANQSTALIKHAEDEARVRLANLSEDVAATFRGLLETQAMHQEKTRQTESEIKSEVQQAVHLFAEFMRINMLQGSKGTKRKAFEATLESLGSSSHRSSPFSLSSRPSLSSSPTISVSSTPASSLQPSQSPNSSSELSSTASLSSPSRSSTAAPFTESEASQPHHEYTSPQNHCYTSAYFPFSNDKSIRHAQECSINNLEQIFPYEKIIRHKYEWDEKSSPPTWLPVISFWNPPSGSASVEDYWVENRMGKDGYFSIQELNLQWQARWKRNQGRLKTEYNRRCKVVSMLNQLSEKTNWNSNLAIRFLRERYPSEARSGRVFSDWLNKSRVAEVLEQANSYSSTQ